MPTPMTDAAQVGKQSGLDLRTLFMVKPELTPALSSLDLEGGLCNQPLNSWLAETFPTVDSTAAVDGAVFTGVLRQERYEIQGYVHNFMDGYRATPIASANAIGGGINRNELGHQRAASLMRLRLKMEQQLLSSTDFAADNGSSTGYTGRGMFSWLSSSAQTTLPVNANVRPNANNAYTGAFADFDEADLVAMLNSMYQDVRARLDYDFFAGVDLKNRIDELTLIHPVSSSTSQPKVQYIEQGVSKYKRNVTVLDISTAMVRLHLAHLVDYTTAGAANTYSTKSGVCINLDMWKLKDLIPLQHKDLVDEGAGKGGYFQQAVLFKCGNPKGQGYVKPTS